VSLHTSLLYFLFAGSLGIAFLALVLRWVGVFFLLFSTNPITVACLRCDNSTDSMDRVLLSMARRVGPSYILRGGGVVMLRGCCVMCF